MKKLSKNERRYAVAFISMLYISECKHKSRAIAMSISKYDEENALRVESKLLSVSNFLDFDIVLYGACDAMERKPGYIYVIHQKESNFYKIGMTSNVTNRFVSLQTANPNELDLKFFGLVHFYSSIENILHLLFEPFNVRGEWFSINDEIANELINIQLPRLFNKFQCKR